ncbi:MULTISPECIES: acetolactate synthase large subunit [unclassified Streptomyces]|uniref:acetolactate synthase large subunit n=1 Tax=unclassified Streptomyces TaxID=2593676 RepID=UPI002DDA4F7A|nr:MULTISPECIES: acetolactate synthase large subunit [unclassified Streptomyces]WSC41132.1 acetolactate synthase large subunit [Streptomyces sp. NBC_01763]WSC51763.1 acetolactate synthase large subunit [Streptomyces sp. NBC_01761]WSF82611.1 acetolactate synthase large subunit [Streptomyces sp. NBC_01744]
MASQDPSDRQNDALVTEDVAHLMVRCLEAEGVEYVFGIPGEENIRFVDALNNSGIRYVLVRHEQGASFMAEMYGRLTGRAGVCSATLGPGAINLLLGTADATTNSTPLVALAAQGSLARLHKESHQVIDLVSMFAPVTQWAACVQSPDAVPEVMRKAFKTAQSERPGAVFLAVPEDIEAARSTKPLAPLQVDTVRADAPSPSQIARAADALATARCPVVLAGHGAARAGASAALVRFAEKLNLPVATTFHGKGVFPDDHPNALGAVGFMRHDYSNFGFDAADVLVCVGYEVQEFDPVKINPDGKKRILHLHRFPAEADAHYPVTVGVEGDLSQSLDALAAAVPETFSCKAAGQRIRALLTEELEYGKRSAACPLVPQRVVADVRAALDREDIVLADTGAGKMWMARLYPAYEPNTCLVSNGLSTMGFALPGAIAAKLARPERKVLAMMGDGSFLMNSQELETAVREHVPLAVLVLVDGEYGLITWKMELELGRHSHTRFTNPDLVTYAESFGARGHLVKSADELLPVLRRALEEDAVSVIACPIDYSENLRLTDRLGTLQGPF